MRAGFGWGKDEGEGGLNALGSSGCGTMTTVSTADLRRRLVKLDAAILEQELVLDGLQRDKTAVRNELYAISTSQFRPFLFRQCLPTIDELREENGDFIRRLMQIVLLGVCRAWRIIALATPALWTTVPIRSKDEAFIDRWLGRAASLSFSMRFHARVLPPRRMRDVIHRYADRMEYLEVRCKPSDIRELKLDSAVFPLLRRVKIGVPEYQSEPISVVNVLEVLTNPPQLRAVVLVNGFEFYILPWLQLTKFEGEMNALDVFRMAPNLVEVKCAVGYLRDSDVDVISLFRLQSLTVTGSSYGNPPTDLLDSFHLPALRSLHLSDTTKPIDLETLADFFRRSAPPLRTLSPSFDLGVDLRELIDRVDNMA
ncbi:hypothetical protein DFH08DRAFT_796672 [Mycena albidolilacea]|uniref:F-box domain-containing protein n=1 Tax=Mycena albidolilacea TaxID=1033008 RepID=A0AAD7F776_9AGAR|nr:hypothetical protein DFH08DRAFT_796672 [Mycena albidolilacea]